MRRDFSWGDELLDSREVMNKYEDLKSEYDDLVDAVDEADTPEAKEEAQEALNEFNTSFDKDELDTLAIVVEQGSHCKGFDHGTPLIHESYFETYIKNDIDELYPFPEGIDTNVWPWNHLAFDYASAAEDIKPDYTTIEADGHTYYLLSQ